LEKNEQILDQEEGSIAHAKQCWTLIILSYTYLHVTVGVTPKAIIKNNIALNVGIPEMQKTKIKIMLLIQNINVI